MHHNSSPLLTRRGLLKLAVLIALAARPASRAHAAQLPADSIGSRSTAEEVTAGLDLSDRTILVTGVNAGLGYETMRVLALRGAHVLGTGRTPEKAAAACASVAGRATPFVLELSDFDSVVACAEAVQTLGVPLDALIANAGVMALPELEQVRGIEKQFVVNHLGHFLLVNRLLGSIEAAQQGRVVVVSSRAHRRADGIDFDNLSGERDYDPMAAYRRSKLANGLFAFELARRMRSSRVTANALHPGVIITDIVRNLPNWQQWAAHWVARPFTKSLAQGAATQCYLATYPTLAAVSGEYFADCQIDEPTHWMRDAALAAKLWAVSAELAADWLA